MKTILRDTIFNAISLFIISELLAGVHIGGGIKTLVLAGLLLSLLFRVIRPILNIFSLPLNMVTLGLFSFFSNAILLYLLTVLVPEISISPFTFNGFTFAGFVVPVMHFGSIYAYVISAAVLSIVMNFFDWLIRR
jgi:putative membrane protein